MLKKTFSVFYFIFSFGPSLSYIRASIASFVMWGSASWIRGSDPAIWTFVPGKHDEVPLQVLWLRILYVELSWVVYVCSVWNRWRCICQTLLMLSSSLEVFSSPHSRVVRYIWRPICKLYRVRRSLGSLCVVNFWHLLHWPPSACVELELELDVV